MVAESWFRSIWKAPKKHEPAIEKAVIGVLAFEIASLMSKLIHLWHSLGEKQVNRLREEVSNSVGIKKLVSDDDEYVGGLIWAEMVDNMVQVAKSVARIGKKCSDPTLKSFEQAFEDWVRLGADPNGWVFSGRKMETKAKKMEKFISLNANLYQEMEVLADLEQTLRRMKESSETEASPGLSEFQKKVTWKQHEVRTLKDLSLWNRTYDYAVLLLARSLFTVFNRIKHVFGLSQSASEDHHDFDHIHRTQSVSTALQPSPCQPRSNAAGLPRFASGPLESLASKSKPSAAKPSKKANTFHSGPLGAASSESRNGFFSGPLARSATASMKSGPLAGMSKYGKKIWQRSSAKPGRLVADRRVTGSVSKWKLAAPAGTLGAGALALHYANVVIVIEKLAASPQLIGVDAREDLYSMLPSGLRALLREKLRPFSRSLASCCDAGLAREWTEAMAAILEWLAPLAHNTIRWQSERSFEQHNGGSKAQVLLVQTLHFASQDKTEATIAELLVGLNYVWRVTREVNAKAMLECPTARIYDSYLEIDG